MRAIRRGTAAVIVLGAVVLTAIGLWWFRHESRHLDVVGLQMAGTAANALLVTGGAFGAYTGAVHGDLVLVGCYTVALLAACLLGRAVFWTPTARLTAFGGLAAAVVGAACNVVQDGFLLAVLHRQLNNHDWVFRTIQALAFVKFCALAVAAPVAVCALATASIRLVRDAGGKGIPVIPPSPREHPSPEERRVLGATPPTVSTVEPPGAGHWRNDWHIPPGREIGGVGICVSGGGVRSASVTLGMLQAFRERGRLAEADYLVSVSGGGYMAGAFQLAGVGSDTPDAFTPGSVEEDHVRRHSSYLSDGFGQWLIGLGVVLRGLVSSLGVIGLTVATIGLAVGRFYDRTRIADLHALQPRFLTLGSSPGFPRPLTGATWAMSVAVGAALLAYVASVTIVRHHKLVLAARALAVAAALVVAVGLIIPTLVWVSGWVTWHTGWHTTKKDVGAGATASVVLSYFGSLAATLWRKKSAVTGATGATSKGSQLLPNSMVQRLLMGVSLLVLSLSLFLASGWVATTHADRSGWALVPVGALVLIALLVDQTWFSMHPFYRGRLASAFAVKRGRIEGRPVAAPYPPAVTTTLSTYAGPVEGFPKVIFAAAANLTGQDRTPPGRRAVSFTFADDYVGGPQVGWVPTADLERVCRPHLRRDLTVEAAVAISGAAFASAMGAQTRFYEVFLALTNARLGAWLPNPYFLWLKEGNTGWTVPGLPDRRRLICYAREIFGLHASTTKLLLCTDGGHYENLGLVELLRHRCRTIYCLDASGDRPPLATTLAEAIALAREELGVEITLQDPLDLVPGSGGDGATGHASLNDRMAKTAVITGDILYPEDDRANWRTGKLVFGKAVLTEDMPYEVLSYAVGDQAFPNDSTADQWFNHAMFDAYQRLGRTLGERMA